MDLHIGHAHGFVLENEAHYTVNGRNGVLRVLFFLNQARMGSYSQTLSSPIYRTDIATTREYGRIKYGFTLGLQQELTRSLAGFARVSGNDGQNETWAYAEIDQSAAIGLTQNGAPWRRSGDELSAAFVLDGISGPHQRYLAAGGYGFMLGDGTLSYALEVIAEVYYRFALTREIAFTPDYQLIVHPGYNSDRGPAHVFGIRAHVQF
jgi:high affinity Mn2+ porin